MVGSNPIQLNPSLIAKIKVFTSFFFEKKCASFWKKGINQNVTWPFYSEMYIQLTVIEQLIGEKYTAQLSNQYREIRRLAKLWEKFESD